MTQAIVFDWGGVLIDYPAPGMNNYFSEYLNIPYHTLVETLIPYKTSFQKGHLTEQQLWQHVATDLQTTINYTNSLWKTAFASVYHEKTMVFQLANQLNRNGYTIGLFSNTEPPAMQFFHDQHYTIFNHLIFSCNEGYIKPETELYHILIKRLQIPPQEILFIDDKHENITAAKKLGLQTILFNNEEQLIDILNQDFHINIHPK